MLTIGGMMRYLVFFDIDLETRRVHIAGITPAADGAWMAQVARNLTDAVAGPLRAFGHLIVDRDPLYCAQFESILAAAGAKLVRLPPSSPNFNAYAERFVRTVRQECLRHIIPLGEQGLHNVIPFPSHASTSVQGRVNRRERVGGLLSFYEREAA